MTDLAPRLTALGNVPADYRHRPKQAVPGPYLLLDDACLKWYDVYDPREATPDEARDLARDFIRQQVRDGGLDIHGELGFVILHRCDNGVYYLDICTWRHANELWESVYIADLGTGGTFRRPPASRHVEIGCVWELGVVRHEVEAWTRFLGSDRDDQAKLTYLTDSATVQV
ncbi:MAG TPA: hypothetical protein VFX60_05645 [Micromonospora sp.]|nr:hypothetical protein [Micromonospora sp.]